jgi:hypothetical protein
MNTTDIPSVNTTRKKIQDTSSSNIMNTLFASVELHTESELRLNTLVMETWLTETMLTAEHTDNNVPQNCVKAEKKEPLKKFGIDRGSLMINGMQGH